MLASLKIENVAVIEKAEVNFNKCFQFQHPSIIFLIFFLFKKCLRRYICNCLPNHSLFDFCIV